MKKISSLYSIKDLVIKKRHLHYAAQKVLNNGGFGGIDGVEVEEFRTRFIAYRCALSESKIHICGNTESITSLC